MVRKLAAEKIKIARRLRSETTMTWSGLCGAMSAPTMKRATCESSRLNPSDADAACAACACITYNSVPMFRSDPFPRLLGDLDDVRTYARKWLYPVKSVYRFFQKRSLCACEECQSDFFDSEQNVARRK